MTKTRLLDTGTLDNAVRDYAGQFLLPTRWSASSPEVAVGGRDWVVQSMYGFHFKDEFDHVLSGLAGYLGQDALADFKAATGDIFTPRDDDVFAQELEERLAIRPDGSRIKGKLGKVIIGERIIGYEGKAITGKTGREYIVQRKIREPVYAGDPDWHQSINATVMNISAESAILMLDALVDNLNEGTGAAVIQGRTGAQPADPDVTTTGTNLFTLVMSDPAFGGAADQADGSIDATASSITDDSSADATGTLGYCRVSATNDGATPLDDHIDGEAGTSGADFNFNTLSIVSGATVSMTSYVISLSQGSTAT